MVHIGHNIYCRKKILDATQSCAKAVSHVARRLIEGVYKPKVLKNATFTGQAPRAQGKTRQNEEVVALDVTAKNAIIGKENFLL